jgi:polysaccharide biosynthesis/export protein
MKPHSKTELVIIVMVALMFGPGRSLAVSPQEEQTASASDASLNIGATTGSAQTAPGEYIIGTDDLLVINVWKEPEISRNVPVRPDGRISLPLVGDLTAGGLTPLQLQNEIKQRLLNYISHPEVTVIVQEIKSQKFNVVGEVEKPGSYPLSRPMTVLDAIAVAGGFRDFAKTTKIYILRVNAEGSRARIPFNYKEVIKGKKLTQNVELEARDTVVVP